MPELTHTLPSPRRFAGVLRNRLRRLRADAESGAQVVEYAMLGAVAAVACGTLIALLKGGLLSALVNSVTNGMTQWAQSWFA
jgi:Flp pilus assembly pilin Flp